MEWELSKENVQPLKEGRNVEKLNAALKARMEGPLKTKIPETHRKMVEAIDDYEGDDPLQPWIECIRWVKEAYPSGGGQSRLLQLLELCARTFCKDRRYADDIRYLKVWMDYADRCSSPKEIYLFLQENNIGQVHALFYEQCAQFWEQQHKFSEARAAYELGISRKAQPLDVLKMESTRFMQRVLRESLAKDEVQSPASQGLSGRSFGNQLAGTNRGQPSQPVRKLAGSKPDRNASQQFSVFVDTDSRPSMSVHKTSGSMFTSEREKNKENVQKPCKLAGVRVRQASVPSTAGPTPVELTVFKDEDCLQTLGELKSRKKNVLTSRSLRLDDINASNREEDRLKLNPLVHFEEAWDDLDFDTLP